MFICFIFAYLCMLLFSLLYRVRYLRYSLSLCSTLTLWVACDLLSYSSRLSRDAYPSFGLSTKKLTWPSSLREIFLMKAPLTASFPKGKEGFGLYYGLNIAQRQGGLICSSLVPQRRSRARRAYLTYAGCPHSRRDLT